MVKRTGPSKSAPKSKSKSAPTLVRAAKNKSSTQGSMPPVGRDPRHDFVQLVMRIGTDEAQRLIDAVVDVQTPLKAALKR